MKRALREAPRTTVQAVLLYADRLLTDAAYARAPGGPGMPQRAWTERSQACDPRHERAMFWSLEGAIIAGAGDRADLELLAFRAVYAVLPRRMYLDQWARAETASACRSLLHRAIAHVVFPPDDAPTTPPPDAPSAAPIPDPPSETP